jgi:uncharacterized radical SAM protein YgiQ
MGSVVTQPRFPPMSRMEMAALGWDECDVIVVTGDAYIDHPSFGSAVVVRVLIDAGFRTGVIAQPRWDGVEDFRQLGRPTLFFGVTAGNVDSMVNHYSPLKQLRREDAYSPGNEMGLRPNRTSIVYCSRLREAYPGVKLVLGGIEASMRRLAHYDYWDDAVRRSILLDAKADIIAYGMAERAVVEIARRVAGMGGMGSRGAIGGGIPGTVVVASAAEGEVQEFKSSRVQEFGCSTDQEAEEDCIEIPSYEEVKNDKKKFLEAFMLWYRESDQPKGKTIIQRHGNRFVIQCPPPLPMSPQELDRVYDLPYQRQAHPHYDQLGKIPALETVKFSITSHRGCLGTCSFCALSAHQGRIIQWRSAESILREARQIVAMPDFKGHITDIGGPTANMYAATCPKLTKAEPCRERECLFPEPCPGLQSNLSRYLELLDAVRRLPGVRNVSIGTGLRYDLITGQDGRRFLEELSRYYISGQLRIAPEHVAARVLDLMHKTPHARYREFMNDFREANQRLGKKQYLIPYFISGFPGCTLEDMVELAEHIEHKEKLLIRQVQDFTPTPMTAATTMYYTGIDPFTGQELYVAKEVRDKKLQRALMQLREPESGRFVAEVLEKSGRKDLLKRINRLRARRNKA